MKINISRSILTAASTGLVLGATACGGNAPAAESPGATDAAAEAKDCCKGLHDCKGKGGCAVEGKQACAGKNECKGQGGCNHHCPS